MENTTVSAGRPLTKEETKVLLSFIEGSKIIYNKSTNATTNKMKTEEWKRISNQFNAVVTTSHRTPQQLRLKWENLKKNSRKRNTLIRMNNIKTGGGGPDYIPPDDVLDRVAALLGSTVDGLTVKYGGDADPEYAVISSVGGGGGRNESESNSEDVTMACILPGGVEVVELVEDNTDNCEATTPNPIQNKITLTPRASGFKKKRAKCMDHRAARDQAFTHYYNIKAKVLEANLENIVLENKKLKLEIEKLQKN